MAKELSKKQIYERMKEWRNTKKLHQAAIQRNEALKQKSQKLRQENQELKKQVKEQADTIETLKLQIEELRKMVFGEKKKDKRESLDDEDKGKPSTPPKKRPENSYKRSLPEDDEITDEYHYKIDVCPDCNTKLKKKTVKTWYEEDIVLPIEEQKSLKKVIKHEVERGYCLHCKKWHSAASLPFAPVILGKKVRIYICYLSILIRLSFEQIITLLETTYRLQVSDGEISKILEKEALTLRPEYESLKEEIRRQKGVHYDETGWRVQEEKHGNYAWVITGAETPQTVFHCGKSRGKANAKDLKGGSDAVGISDNYGAYRGLFDEHQLCFAHPHRKLRDLAESKEISEKTRKRCRFTYERFSSLYRQVREIVELPFNLEDRERERACLLEEFDDIVTERSDDPPALIRIKKSLRRDREKYFTCLLHEGIPPDNNKAERALRHLVLKRKNSFGSKTQKGSEVTSVLASVILSLWWQKPKNFFEEFIKLRGA